MKEKKSPPPESTDPEFQNLVKLLAIFSEASNRIDTLQAEATADHLETIDHIRDEYAALQQALTESGTALELIVLKHPEWFATKRSIKTAFGTVKLHTSHPLVIPNEEVTQLLIEKEIEGQKLRRADPTAPASEFDAAALLRTRIEIDREALEKLDESQLKKLRVHRERKDNFSVAPAKLDLGAAVKLAAAATEQEAA